jgi:hypothetical protein
MTTRERLLNALTPLGFEVYLQGSLAADQPLPATFITYFVLDGSDQRFYDSQATLSFPIIQLVLYATKLSVLNTLPDLVSTQLKAHGFVREGRGRDMGYEGHHYGWVMTLMTTERNIA